MAALRSYAVLDTASEEAFDNLVVLAARLTRSPIALVSLVDDNRQWFKARHGLDAQELQRDHAFCAHAILDPDHPLVVEDAMKDPRFQDNPLVTGAAEIRAYLGVPLVNPEGHALGSFCIVDRVARHFDAETIDTMRTLARAVAVNLELRRALLRSQEAALTDSLTGLPNRRALIDGLMKAAANSDPVAVIAVDLDHFKEVNDSEGHAAGDALLKVAADRLRKTVRPGDLVGRVGGDEFVVLLRGVTEREDVAEITRRISTALHRPVQYGSRQLRLGATLGVAVVPGDVVDPAMALRVADEALINSKRTGRGTIAYASQEDAAQSLRAAAIVHAFDMDAAASNPLQGAIVHLQPIMALGCGLDVVPRIVAVEALARWSHPAVGEIPPGDLFSVIGPERAAQLGQIIRKQAFAAFAALRTMGLADARIALNLSASEVSRVDIALGIAQQVEQAGLSLRCVDLEITEDVLLDRVSDRTLDQLAALRGRGARLILDDFGTGTSGLAQLLRLPLDGVKLDMQFVQRLGMDPRAEEIVRATISLAHGLGLQVVAEGVETGQQAAMLQALNCDTVQGFLYARPMAPDVLAVWLRERALHTHPSVIALRPKAAKEAG